MEVRQCAANLATDARAFACTLKCISRDQDERWPSRAETHTRLSATCSVKNWPATYRREPTAYPANSRFSTETEKFEIVAMVESFLLFFPFLFFFSFLFSFLRREGQRNDYCLLGGDFMEANRFTQLPIILCELWAYRLIRFVPMLHCSLKNFILFLMTRDIIKEFKPFRWF